MAEREDLCAYARMLERMSEDLAEGGGHTMLSYFVSMAAEVAAEECAETYDATPPADRP